VIFTGRKEEMTACALKAVSNLKVPLDLLMDRVGR